jgi:hypothetical protein
MTILYSFVDCRGVTHDIKQKHIEESFRILINAGFDRSEANDKAIDYVIARIQLDAVPLGDLLYHSHDYDEEERLCSLVATRLQQRGISQTA